ncbi:unnamed protein product [Lathyrus sativus]|nr:unnamed protein product [Lathyrus sativus]
MSTHIKRENKNKATLSLFLSLPLFEYLSPLLKSFLFSFSLFRVVWLLRLIWGCYFNWRRRRRLRIWGFRRKVEGLVETWYR